MIGNQHNRDGISTKALRLWPLTHRQLFAEKPRQGRGDWENHGFLARTIAGQARISRRQVPGRANDTDGIHILWRKHGFSSFSGIERPCESSPPSKGRPSCVTTIEIVNPLCPLLTHFTTVFAWTCTFGSTSAARGKGVPISVWVYLLFISCFCFPFSFLPPVPFFFFPCHPPQLVHPPAHLPVDGLGRPRLLEVSPFPVVLIFHTTGRACFCQSA
ncbi:hypothetical protein BDV59DRAFT_155288 [Aspergillus ambiguus]|uniref:uncharacterized protein n=1 Tax=Aspergillus ambiguus TaxID=176160 RepID=UPI003CCC92D7